jgi:hypothetical protein
VRGPVIIEVKTYSIFGTKRTMPDQMVGSAVMDKAIVKEYGFVAAAYCSLAGRGRA